MTTSDGARTTLFLRGMSRDLVREVKAVAARRGTTLGRVVSEAIRRSLEVDAEQDTDDLSAAMAWYRAHRAALMKGYAGAYVAIVDDAVLDHDTDFSRLAARVFKRIGERPVFMPRVGAQSDVVRVRSPRIRR